MKISKFHVIYLILLISISVIIPVILTRDHPDKPIVIYSDEDFDRYNFAGTGTVTDPFLIENLQITRNTEEFDPDSGIGIRIYNTSKHFVIQNCRIIGYLGGIFLYKITNGTGKIINNNISNTFDWFSGIDIYYSNHITIENNTIMYTDVGISLYKSHNSEISNNIVCRNDIGIMIDYSHFVDVMKNNCSENKWGFYISDSNFTNIVLNHFFKNSRWWEVDPSNVGTGIEIHFGFNLNICNNTISENNRFGIYAVFLYLSSISFNNISFNHISTTFGNGIRLEGSNYNNITYNLVEKNRKYGIFIDQSIDNIIHHNAFIQNSQQPSANVISTYYSNNTWFDIANMEGNYWEGWNTSIPFAIQGETTVDPYPLEENPVELELYFIVLER